MVRRKSKEIIEEQCKFGILISASLLAIKTVGKCFIFSDNIQN